MHNIIKILQKPKIFVFTFFWMMILVVLGTLAQRDMGLFAVQNKYYSSWIIWFDFFPMPGGRLTLIIMLINLCFFFFNKNIWQIKKLGIVILHIGGILLLVGGGLTAMFSSEGNMVIDEGSQSNYVEDYHYMELAVINVTANDFDDHIIFDQPLLNRNKILSHEKLNFEIEILEYLENCQPEKRLSPAGIQYKGMLKNFMLTKLKLGKEEICTAPDLFIKSTIQEQVLMEYMESS